MNWWKPKITDEATRIRQVQKFFKRSFIYLLASSGLAAFGLCYRVVSGGEFVSSFIFGVILSKPLLERMGNVYSFKQSVPLLATFFFGKMVMDFLYPLPHTPAGYPIAQALLNGAEIGVFRGASMAMGMSLIFWFFHTPFERFVTSRLQKA